MLSTEYFIAAALTTTFVDRLGRRPTMIWGAIGCGLAFVAATVLVYFSDRDNSRGAAWGAVAMYFVYNSCESYLRSKTKLVTSSPDVGRTTRGFLSGELVTSSVENPKISNADSRNPCHSFQVSLSDGSGEPFSAMCFLLIYSR